MSKLLLDDYPVLLIKELGRMGFSAAEAAILQQVHYWTRQNEKAGRNLHQGNFWTYNTYEQWAEELVFWSIRTIRRAITGLEKKEILIVGNFNKLKIDQTKWYRLNYQALNSLKIVSGNGQVKMASPIGQNGLMGDFIEYEGRLIPESHRFPYNPDEPVTYPNFDAIRFQYAVHQEAKKDKRKGNGRPSPSPR